MLWVRGPLRFLSGIERPGNTGGVTVATGRGEDRVRVGAFRTPGRGSCIAWSLEGDARAGCSHPASAPSRPAAAGARSWPAPGPRRTSPRSAAAPHTGAAGRSLWERWSPAGGAQDQGHPAQHPGKLCGQRSTPSGLRSNGAMPTQPERSPPRDGRRGRDPASCPHVTLVHVRDFPRERHEAEDVTLHTRTGFFAP